MAVHTKQTIRLHLEGINLEETLFCGQSFAWRREEGGGYTGVAGPYAVKARAEGDDIVLESLEGGFDQEAQAFWSHYFAADTDYAALVGRFRQDETLARCTSAAPGVRVLRQPFFETLLCFIISQNNHIPRITGIVTRLRELFGQRFACGEYAFPTPGRLAALTVEDLAPLRAGFRAKYLLDAAKRVAGGEVNEAELRNMEDEEARRALTTIYGVGTKVADCVLLYSLGRSRVVPMDVWMKRAMEQHIPGGMPPQAEGCEGIAQQFIFCYMRQRET